MLSLRLSFVVKNRRSYGIANYAKLSFLAGTRNLMIMVCSICFLFYRRPCAVFETRSLVLARDDGIVGTCCVLWVFTVFVLRQKNIRTKVFH